jgi:hypothetical protein
MQRIHLKTTIALALIGAAFAAVPAHAVQISFTGGSNIGNLNSVTGTDGIGDAWQTSNATGLINSSFAMADFEATPQAFNQSNFSNGNGTFATSFQMTVNSSQAGIGFKGILPTLPASGIANRFIVAPTTDPATWVTWNASYNLLDSISGLYQQVTFTAPVGTALTQGTDFSVNVNFSGIMTADSGWAASFDDRGRLTPAEVPEPSTYLMLLAGLGMIGLMTRRRMGGDVSD